MATIFQIGAQSSGGASSGGAVAYDPNNPTIQGFLGALAQSEGNAGPTQGFGYADLSGFPTDAYGFPTWPGGSTSAGPTHAAGPYQFQPGTWDSIAQAYGLNFSNPQDQAAGAWYEAQQVDPQLYNQLSAGDYTDVQNALVGTWAGAAGSASNPQGLAGLLASGAQTFVSGGGNTGAPNTGAASAQQILAGGNQSLGFLGGIKDVEQFFLRFGLIIIGAVVVVVALWQLLADHTALSSPGQAAKGVGEALAAA